MPKRKVPCKKCYVEGKDFNDQVMMDETDKTSTITDGYTCPDCGYYMPDDQVTTWLEMAR